jgi:hypothetical protein
VVYRHAGSGAADPDQQDIGTAGLQYWYGPNLSSPGPVPQAVAVSAFLCDVTRKSDTPWRYCGRFTGLASAVVTLDGANPTHYTTLAGTIAPPDAQPATSFVAAANFFAIRPGRHTLHVEPAPTAPYTHLDCSMSPPGGSGWSEAWRQIDPTTFEIIALPDLVNLSARLWCTTS